MVNSETSYIYCRDGYDVFEGELLRIGKASEGINLPDIVRFDYKNQSSIGYIKYDENLFNNNSLEFVLYQLLKGIQIDSAKTLRVYNDASCKKPVAILSIDVTDGTDYEFINFREMRDELFFDLKNKIIPETKWIKDWIAIRNRRTNKDLWELRAQIHSDYVNCIKFPFEIAGLWCDKHGLYLKQFSESISKILAFDILIGQADRSPSNYGLLVDNVNHRAKMAPLFDNATITKPYIDLYQNSFNQLLLNREKLALVAGDILGNDFRIVICRLLDNKSTIIATIKKYKSDLEKDNYNLLKNRVEEGMLIFEKLLR